MIQLARAQAMCQPSICHLRDCSGHLQILGSILLGGGLVVMKTCIMAEYLTANSRQFKKKENYIYIYIYIYISTHTHTHIHIYIHIS